MKIQNQKKGFTIVELVIVIAVIAILAAVLIPTFSGLVKKAQLSADKQLVAQMNKIVQAEALYANDGTITFAQAVAALKENGVQLDDDEIEMDASTGILKNYSMTASGYKLQFNTATGKFGIWDEEESKTIYPEEEADEACVEHDYQPTKVAPDGYEEYADGYHFYQCKKCGQFEMEYDYWEEKDIPKGVNHTWNGTGVCTCGKESEYKDQIVYVAELNAKLTETYPTMYATFDALRGDKTIADVISGIDTAEGSSGAKILWDQVTQKFVVVTGTTSVVYPEVSREQVQQYELWDVCDNTDKHKLNIVDQNAVKSLVGYSVYWGASQAPTGDIVSGMFSSGGSFTICVGFDMGLWEPQKNEKVCIMVNAPYSSSLIIRTNMGEMPDIPGTAGDKDEKDWRKIQISGSSPKVSHYGDFLKVQFNCMGTASYTEYGNVQYAKFDSKTVNLYIKTEKSESLLVSDWTYTQNGKTKTVAYDGNASNVTVYKIAK